MPEQCVLTLCAKCGKVHIFCPDVGDAWIAKDQLTSEEKAGLVTAKRVWGCEQCERSTGVQIAENLQTARNGRPMIHHRAAPDDRSFVPVRRRSFNRVHSPLSGL